MTTVYHGHTSHRRFVPTTHRFRFDLSMVLFDADRLGGETPTLAVGDGSIVDRRDLFDGAPSTRLGVALRDLIAERTGRRATGPVRALCIPRSAGYVFNPLTVYWVLSPEGRSEVVVLEVTNTPWKERHWYVIDARTGATPGDRYALGDQSAHGVVRACFDKELHVSPFGLMDERYEASVSRPGEAITVVLRNLGADDRPVLLARLDLIAAGDAPTPRRRWMLTRRVWLAIHWQALRLLAKRVPLRPHPRPVKPTVETTP